MKMTKAQLAVMKCYKQNKFGAIKFESEWIWLDDVKKNADLATRMFDNINELSRPTSLGPLADAITMFQKANSRKKNLS